MSKTRTVKVKTTARTCGNGHIHVRSTINNGHTTKTISKTIRVR